MHELKESDREAILLRYFEDRPFIEVGAKLGLNENAARMRVERALEKLRAIFARRGVVTTSALAAAIAANAVQTAPAALTATLTEASIVSAGTGTVTLLKIMTATKLKLILSVLAVAGATTAWVVQLQSQAKLNEENQSLRQQMMQLRSDNESLSNRVVAGGNTESRPKDQFNELLKLRGEVGGLHRQIGEIGKLREENQRLRTTQLEDASLQQAGLDAKKQEQHAAMQKINDSQQGILAFIMFAADNHQQFPTNFAQASRYLKEVEMEQIETNFDIVYQGPIPENANAPGIIVLKEKQAWQARSGKWMKTYGFADGHSEIHTEPNGNFDDWENQHTIPPSN